MNFIEKEIKKEKIESNIQRRHYLKVLSITCLLIDMASYIMLESIELAFRNLTKNYLLLMLFFLTITGLILIGVIYNKNTLLKINVFLYFILGLGLFFYLIVQEMQASGTGMKPIVDPKPEIYYKVFLNIIIALNIIGGVFRMLCSIFMLIFIKISDKIKKGIIYFKILILATRELNESLIMNNESSFNSKSLDGGYINFSKRNSIKENLSKISKEKTSHNSIIEPTNNLNVNNLNKSKNTSIIVTNRSSIISEYNNNNAFMINPNIYNGMSSQKDMNIYLNNNNNNNQYNNITNNATNNIHVHVYNFNNHITDKNLQNSSMYSKILPKICGGTFESNDMDKERDELIDSMLETPKNVSFANNN